MDNDTLIFKPTAKGLIIDSVVGGATLQPNEVYHVIVSTPDNSIKVILPEKSNLEIFSTWAIIIGGLAGVVGALIAFWQLFKKDKIKETQIEQLIEQTRINQKRLRMLVKPRIWSNGGGRVGGRIIMDIDNRGELGFYDGYEIIDGENVAFEKWNRPIEIGKDARIKLTAPDIDKRLDNIQFRIKILYHDQEDFKYETIFDWKGGRTKLIETKEF